MSKKSPPCSPYDASPAGLPTRFLPSAFSADQESSSVHLHKLISALPNLPNQLELFECILTCLPVFQQVDNLDLTIRLDPFSNSRFLFELVCVLLQKFQVAKVVKFPKLNIYSLKELLSGLKPESTTKYDIIHLDLLGEDFDNSIFEKLLQCQPKKICLHAPNVKLDKINNFFKRKKVPVETKVEDSVITILFTETELTFTFDCYTLSPVGTSYSKFTAYDYWKVGEIHRFMTGLKVKVAIVDTGIDINHPAFEHARANIINGFNAYGEDYIDTNGHGTLCAGILCGREFSYRYDPENCENGSNKKFPCGIAPDVSLTVYKVTNGNESFASPVKVAEAVYLMAKEPEPFDVLNISMGSLIFSEEVAAAINFLMIQKGTIVVCAASNHGHKFSQPICYPARLGNVLCIGSHGLHGKPSPFSPVGQEIDFLAPGEDVWGPYSTAINPLMEQTIKKDSGTSYAAPAVTGLICLILQYIKCIDPNSRCNHCVMKEILRKISTCPGHHTEDKGYGALNPMVFFRDPKCIIESIIAEMFNGEPYLMQ